MTTNALNPFAKNETPVAKAMTEVASAREVQEVQAAMMIAKRFPRDERLAVDKILNACTRPSLAEGALYSYNRGGSEITGPSIRLAEAMAQAWCNIQFGIRELEQRDGESTIEAFAWDLETNTRQSKVFQVAHERHTKRGTTKLTDPRDIYELVANQGARRLRACILGVIPGDVTEAAVNQCEVTLHSKADTGPDAIKKLEEAFDKFNVTRQQIEKRIGQRLDSIRPAQMVALRKIYASIKDGMSAPKDWFDFEAETSSLNDELAEKVAKQTAKKAETKPEPKQNELFTSLLSAAATAKTDDEQAEILDAARELSQDERDQITAAMKKVS